MGLCSLPLSYLGPNYGGGNEDNGDLFQKVPCSTATLSVPNPASGHLRPTHLLESPGHSQASLGQSLVESLLLSPDEHKVLFVLSKRLSNYLKHSHHFFFSILIVIHVCLIWEGYSNLRLPRWLSGKEPTWQCKRHGFYPWVRRRSPGVGNGNLFQYSCLKNSMDWGAWWATAHGVTKSQTRLSD